MLAELTKKQRELDELREAFRNIRTFALELRRSTKSKRFDIANTFAWEAVLAWHRMLVIDLAAWVDSLLPPRRPRPGELGWLRKHLHGSALSTLTANKARAVGFAANEWVAAPADVQRVLREHRAQEIHQGHQAVLRRLFGAVAVRREYPIEKDVLRLEKRLFRWARNLRRWRNTHAHTYGGETGTVRALRLADLAKRFAWCGRLMNDLRLLLDSSTYVMTRLEPSQNDSEARDLVDIIVVGTISFAVEQWSKEKGPFLWQKRDAYYDRLHSRRRRKKTDPFNRPT